MKPSRSTSAAVLLAIALTGCSAQGEESPPRTTATAASAADSQPDEPTGHGKGHGGHAGHLAPKELSAALITAADLPDGYRRGAGHHHADPASLATPQVPAGCLPIAQLIGTHPSVLQSEHPQARISFSKGHYGPQFTQTVIDLGGVDAASVAFERVRSASESCDRYVQSTSPTGAQTYTVEPGEPLQVGQAGVSLRLDAVGSDFDGLYWDLWVSRSRGRLVAVAHRSALGGDNDDLVPAVTGAIDMLGT